MSAGTVPPPAPAVERELVGDMARRAVLVAPVVISVCALGWGVNGAVSAAVAIALVLVNMALSAAILSRAARISLTMIAVAALGGFLLRMAAVVAAIFFLKDRSWIELVPLCFTLLTAHLGLLIWEATQVSASLAFPGLKPRPGRQEV